MVDVLVSEITGREAEATSPACARGSTVDARPRWNMRGATMRGAMREDANLSEAIVTADM